MRRRNLVLFGGTIPLALIAACPSACQSASPARPSASPANAATASASASASSALASDADASAPATRAAGDPLAAVKARGVVHGEPIKLPPSSRGDSRWLVLLGTKEIARAAWLVSPGDPRGELTPVESWPSGVKVVGHTERAGVVYLLLETVALLDQAPGVRAVWFDGFGNASPFALAPPSAFFGVHEMADLEKRLDQGPPPARDLPPEGLLMAQLKGAQGSEAALAKIVSPRGVDLYDTWQQLFASAVEHVEPSRLAASSHAPAMLSIVRDAIKSDQCEADACEAETERGRASIDFVLEPGAAQNAKPSWRIRAFEWDSSPPPTTTWVAPHVVNASATTAETEAVLAEHVRKVSQVLGEAPLYTSGSSGARGGTIGVAITDREADGPTIAVKEGDHTRVFPLSSMSFVAANASDAKFEARFADLDGDGRTDVVLRATGTAKDGTPIAFAQAFLAPPPSVQVTELTADHATELAVAGAPTIDAGVQAALGVAARGVPLAEACKVLQGANVLATFRKVSTADVRVLSFEEPSMPTYRARVTSESKLRQDDVKDAGRRCKDFECSPTRPVCSYSEGPYNEFYWFTWDNNVLRLSGAAFYSGG